MAEDAGSSSAGGADVASLKSSLAALQAKVEEVTALQAKAGK
jgi:hypothetical protein